MERDERIDAGDGRDLMLLFGGAALVVLGTGLMLAHPLVRRYLGDLDISRLASGALPDFDRYLKLRSM